MSKVKRILVTGGAGFIGSHTVAELAAAGYEPVIVDNLYNSYPFVIDRLKDLTGQSIPFYQADCADYKAMRRIFEMEDLDGVIHFAAFKAVGESVNIPVRYYHNNLSALLTLLQHMEMYGVKNLVFSSSCTVYGEPEHLPVDESTPTTRPSSPYGNTKRVCEEIIEDTCNANKGLNGISLRYFNPIGAHPSAKIGELPIGKPNNLVPFITQTASGLRDELTVFGNDYDTPDGSCLRDYIHVVDLAKAHLKALEYVNTKKADFFDVFNVGCGKGNTVLDVINTFEKVSGQKVNYKFGDRRPGDVPKIYASVEKIKKELNWECEFSLDDALTHAWKWQEQLKQEKLFSDVG